MKTFDLIVLGGGPGGYVAAIRAAQLGLKTALVEKEHLGGVCLNWGCIPTKALLWNAEVLALVKNARRYGIAVSGVQVDFPATIKRSRQAAERLSRGVEYLLKNAGVTTFFGSGKLQSAREIEITETAGTTTIAAEKIIIATGARPRSFPGLEPDGRRILTVREVMVLEKPPAEMVIVGAGAIGVEFAWFYRQFGTEIHLVEMLPRILPQADPEISAELEKSFIKAGLKLYRETRVVHSESSLQGVTVTAETPGRTFTLKGDIVLNAVGVTGNVEGLGAESAGLETSRNLIPVDAFGQTNLPGVYAVGDVTGPPWLAHVASAQGRIAAEHAAGRQPEPLNLHNVPACIYCRPQVASAGMTEPEARASGQEIRVGRFPYLALGKSVATGETSGFAKLIFEAGSGRILGCHIIGAEATELIAEAALALSLKATWRDLAHTVHAHPTLSEIMMEAAADAFGEAIHH